MTERLTIDSLSVTIEHKRIKNTYLRVLPPDGRVTITAPNRMKEDAVIELVRVRRAWINRQRERYAGYVEPKFETGEAALLWGERLTLFVTHQRKRAVVTREADVLHLDIAADASAEKRKRALDVFYKGELLRKAQSELPACEAIVGKRAGQIAAKDMRSRWGSCNVNTAHITLNLALAHRQPEALRYVLIHELCHLHERGHGKRFYARMDAFCPDWREIRARLNAPDQA